MNFRVLGLFIFSILLVPACANRVKLKDPKADRFLTGQVDKRFSNNEELEIKKGGSREQEPDIYEEGEQFEITNKGSPKREPAAAATPLPVDVNLKKTDETPKPEYPIVLTDPPHKSTFTSGIIQFRWIFAVDVEDSDKNSKKKKKAKPMNQLIVEKLDKPKQMTLKTDKLYDYVNFSPGKYRWRVTREPGEMKSPWRTFTVIRSKTQIKALVDSTKRKSRKPANKR